MPKMSYAGEVAALEKALATVRARAGLLHPFALAVAAELEEQVACAGKGEEPPEP